MRLGTFAVAILAAASWACSSGSKTPAGEKLAVDLTGWWIGTQTAAWGGVDGPPTTASMEITASDMGVNLGEACPDGTPVPAVGSGPTSLTVPPYACPAAPYGSCATAVMRWTGGSATFDRGLLSLEMKGSLEGCGTSVSVSIAFDALRDALPPELTALAPTFALVRAQGTAVSLAGTGFAPKAVVHVGGLAVATTFVSETELSASVPPSALSAAGEVSVTVTNVDAQSSLPLTFQVRNPAPEISGIAPATIVAGTPGATVAINGSGFVSTSQATCGGMPRSTTYVAPTRVMVSLTAEDLAIGIDRTLTVSNAPPGGGDSGEAVVHVVNPAPLPTAIFPSTFASGGPRTFVTVSGSQFVPGTVAYLDGSPRRTYFSSTTRLSAELLATDLVAEGTATLSVESPTPGGGAADAGTITVGPAEAAPSQSVAYQVDPTHSGRAVLGSALAYPAAKAWSVSLPDLASYPIVANGKAFVLVRGAAAGGYGTRLYALDLATGATAWGPIAIQGTYYWSGLAYEAGRIFVLNYDGTLRTFDSATGTAGWSVVLPGQGAFSSAPTVSGGVVFAGGAGVGGTVYAVDATEGTLLWSRSVANGDQSSPAVTPDAVYVSYPCHVYKLDRQTGAPIWSLGGCSGGGGKTTAYSAGSLYVRDFGFGDPYGTIYDALDGTATGTFGSTAYLPIPALDEDARYVLVNGTLERWEASAKQATWSFTGDAQLASAPLVINDAVVVGSQSGKVFAVDALTGLEEWSDAAGAPVLAPDEQNVSQPLTGLGVGEGYLIVPASSRVTAWKIVAP